MHLNRRKKQQARPSSQQISCYPPGTFIQTEKGWFYVKDGSTRLTILTDRLLDSYNPIRVVTTTEGHPAVAPLRVAGKLKFRNGSLLYSHASGKMYLISQGKLRHVTNPDVLTELGFKRSDAVWVSLDEINLHERGEPLNG